MLTTCTGASVGIYTDIFILNFNVDIFLNFRHDIQRNKGGLSFALGIKGGNTHQTVYALLGFQITVGIFSIDLEGH